jgi:hypothetical protein
MWILVKDTRSNEIVRVNSDYIIAYYRPTGQQHTLLYLAHITGLMNPMTVEETDR